MNEYFVRERSAITARNRIDSCERQIASYERQIESSKDYTESLKGTDRYDTYKLLYGDKEKEFTLLIEKQREKIIENEKIIAEEGTPDDEILQAIDYYVTAKRAFEESRLYFIKNMFDRVEALRETNRDEALRVSALIPDGDPLYEEFENYLVHGVKSDNIVAAIAYDPSAKWRRKETI
jgi:hypothetical protein